MSYHGKLQVLKNGTADAEIQQWAHNELAIADINFENAERIIQEQKAEIEALKQSKFDNNNKVNNEPVAWMQSKTTELPDGCECMQSVSFFKANDNDIPLYTHPVKELTDEEIMEIFQEQTGFYFDDNPADDLALMDFARAILRKAQEK